MKTLIHRAHALALQYNAQARLPPPTRNPGATAAAIARVEAKLGSLPPPYRALLAEVNGWTAFYPEHGRSRLFSTDELLDPAYDELVAGVRAKMKRWKFEPLVEGKALVVGSAGADQLFLVDLEKHAVSKDHALRVVTLKPRMSGGGSSVERFLEAVIASYESLLAVATPGDPAALLEEARAAFRYPEEMGERPDDSIEELHAIRGRLPASAVQERREIDRMIAELAKGYEHE